jgi:ribosome-associated toxin RatA of RatAB toxin-antitoxin module
MVLLKQDSMKHVKRSVLLWYSPLEMYELVTAIDAYPQFLPWCERAEVCQRHDDGVTARLHLSYLGVRHAFTTRNVQVPGESVVIGLVDGPFSLLDGTWRFIPLSQASSSSAQETERACRIEFDLRYAFASRTLELVVSPVFDAIANTFVDSFVKRAQQVYGER